MELRRFIPYRFWTLAALAVLLYAAGAWALLRDMPSPQTLWRPSLAVEMRFTTPAGEPLARRGTRGAAPLGVAQYPPALVQAVVAVEDKRFFRHFGFDPYGIARAGWANLRAGRIVEGGSTLTQQLAKNVFLTPERTFKRKVQELCLALWLEASLSKNEILALYLNRVYFGAGAYGARAAAERYFARPVQTLTLAEAAALAGLLKAPSRLAPTEDLLGARQRAARVLGAMEAQGYITRAERKAAASAEIALVGERSDSLQYAVDWAVQRLEGLIGSPSANLQIELTLEPSLQRRGARALKAALADGGAAAHVEQGAVVVLGHDGAVRALVGGRDIRRDRFNRAVHPRVVGSAFLPFVWLVGLETGYRPDSRFRERAVAIPSFTPDENAALGYVSLARGLARSSPSVALQLGEAAGLAHVSDLAQRFGFVAEPSSVQDAVLGAWRTDLVALTAAYARLASGGLAVQPYIVQRVETGSRRRLYVRRAETPSRLAAPRLLAFLDTMLTATLPPHPVADNVAPSRLAVWGKSGNSRDAQDVWMLGYTDGAVIGVWLGNDDGAPMVQQAARDLAVRLFYDLVTGDAASPHLSQAPSLRTNRRG